MTYSQFHDWCISMSFGIYTVYNVHIDGQIIIPFTWICFVVVLLRIGIPWDSSPSRPTIWDNIFGFVSKHQTSSIQVQEAHAPTRTGII